jgi:hypothetical protein
MDLVFNSIESLREYAPRLTVSRFETVREFVANATLRSVAPTLGALYDELAAYLNGEASGNAPLDALAPYARRAVAYYAMFGFIRAGGALITAQGVQKAETETHKSSSYGDKMDTLNYYAEEADAALDALLSFVESARDNYPAYTPAAPFALIGSAEAYGRYVNIGGSRRTYLALLPELRNAERFTLLPLLGEELLGQLQRYAAGNNDALSGTALEGCAAKALEYAQAAAANAAICRAMPSLTLRCHDGAVGVASFYSPSAQERTALLQVIGKLREQAAQTASACVELLTNLLRAPEASSARMLANSAESKHYVTPFF